MQSTLRLWLTAGILSMAVTGRPAAAVQPPRASGMGSAPAASERPSSAESRSAIPATISTALNSADVRAYLGGLVPLQLVRGDLAGAAVIVIQDGNVLVKQGYGFADVSRQVAVNPDQTMFRFGSISKLMTYVSAMQLVEQDRLDLDTDINQYLDFKIEPAFGQPVTLRNLMTHTAGFEHQQQYILTHETDTKISLRDYLIRFQPKRIYAPGTIGSYSDYGVGLIGYLVQRVSGEPFPSYVQHHIFDPAGMQHSTFEQPLPPALRPLLSKGYFSSARPPGAFELFNPAPAGAMSATLADIARFAQIMTHGGAWNGHRILRPETVQQMWTRQYAISPALPAMCLGFYEVNHNGLRFVGHNGDTRLFHAQLEIQPERKLIVLSAYNSAGADGSGQDSARWEVLDGFLDRYFPFHQTPTWKPVDLRGRQIEGTFIKARRMESGRLKLNSLLDQIRIKVNSDGELINRMATDGRGHPIKLRYLGNDLWQDEAGQGRLMAMRDRGGRVIGLASMFGATLMVRVPWWENACFVLPFAAFGLAASALLICGMLLRFLRRVLPPHLWRPSRPPGASTTLPSSRMAIPFSTAQRLAAIVWIPAVPMLLALFVHIARQPLPNFDRVPYYFLLQNILVTIAILLSIPSVFLAVRVLFRMNAGLPSRLKHAAVGTGYAFLIWFSLHWHLLGPINRY